MERSKIAQEMRKRLGPLDGIKHEEARRGSEILLGLEDDKLVSIYELLVEKRAPFDVVVSTIFGETLSGEERTAVMKALLRVYVRVQSLAQETGEGVKPKSCLLSQDALRMEERKSVAFLPPSDFFEQLEFIEQNAPYVNAMRELAWLQQLQKVRLFSILNETSRVKSALVSAKVVDDAVNTLRAINRDLAQVQLATGVLKREPDKIEVSMKDAGQLLLDGMTEESRKSWEMMARRFSTWVKRHYAEQGGGESE